MYRRGILPESQYLSCQVYAPAVFLFLPTFVLGQVRILHDFSLRNGEEIHFIIPSTAHFITRVSDGSVRILGKLHFQ